MNEVDKEIVPAKRRMIETPIYEPYSSLRKRIKYRCLNKAYSLSAPDKILEEDGDRQNSYFTNNFDSGDESQDFITGRDLTKLLISNLDVGISDCDIIDLFRKFGPLQSYKLHYDTSGRCKGTAEVIFRSRSNAMEAMDYYNEKLFCEVKEWQKSLKETSDQDCNVRNAIISTVDDELLRIIVNCNTSCEMWTKLNDHFTCNSENKTYLIYKKFRYVKIKKTATVEQFIKRHDEILQEASNLEL